MIMLEHIWQNFLDIVRQEVGSRVVETWLKAVTLERWDAQENIAYINTPNSFIKDWINCHYLPLFHEHLARLFAVSTINVVLNNNNSQKSDDAQTIMPARRAPITHEPAGIELPERIPATLNETYLLDTFCVGQSNALTYAAACAITQKPGVVYNPLFVYGSTGMGKTHLLNAIGNEIKRRFKRLSVLYQPADRFVSEFISAIRFDKVEAFKDRYRQLDVLLIDDVQCIAHKEGTQEVFFYIFNNLYEASKQIVCSCDTYPRNLRGFSERLRSRLEGGLVIDMRPPTLDEKIMILQKKAERAQVALSSDLARVIAQQAISVRELEGALIRMCAVSSLTNQTLTTDLAQKILQRPLQPLANTLGLAHIAHIVAQHFNYNMQHLRSKSRCKDLALVRQITMYLMKQLTHQSMQSIGTYLNRHNHTTVMHAIHKIDTVMKHNPQLYQTIQSLQEKIQK